MTFLFLVCRRGLSSHTPAMKQEEKVSYGRVATSSGQSAIIPLSAILFL